MDSSLIRANPYYPCQSVCYSSHEGELRLRGTKKFIVTARAIHKGGRLIFHDPEDIPEDGTEVIASFERHAKTPIHSLRESWAKYFPKDFDLDAEMERMRKEWEQEMEEIGG